jgi:hypothetical protein
MSVYSTVAHQTDYVKPIKNYTRIFKAWLYLQFDHCQPLH